MEYFHSEFSCPFKPDFTSLEPRIHEAVEFSATSNLLKIKRMLNEDEIASLRACHADSAGWLILIDKIKEREQLTRITASSAYPATNWSLLLTGLGSGSADPWQDFMNSYRKPIEKSLARLLSNWNQHGHSASQLADDFFGWFFSKKYHQKLKRTDENGKVNRFRGYLKFVLKYYLKDAVLPKRSASNIDRIAEESLSQGFDLAKEVDKTVDHEISRELTYSTLEVMKRDEYASWRAFLADLSGLTLSDVSERMKADPDAKGTSVSQIYRERSRARDQFRNWLIRYRLDAGCLTREEAVDEFHDLIPALAASLSEYRDEHQGEII